MENKTITSTNSNGETVTTKVHSAPIKAIDILRLNVMAYAYEITTGKPDQMQMLNRDTALTLSTVKLPTNYETRG